MTEQFYGIPLEQVERVRAEGKELVPVGRNVPWRVTEEIVERCFPDSERQLRLYRSMLETLRNENMIQKTFIEVIPENGDPSRKVVDINVYREKKQNG